MKRTTLKVNNKVWGYMCQEILESDAAYKKRITKMKNFIYNFYSCSRKGSLIKVTTKSHTL